jgi:hypothetical protein
VTRNKIYSSQRGLLIASRTSEYSQCAPSKKPYVSIKVTRRFINYRYRYPSSSRHGSDTEQSGDDDDDAGGGNDDDGNDGGREANGRAHVIKEEPNSQVPMDTTPSGSNIDVAHNSGEERMQEIQDHPYSDWVKVEPQDNFNLSPPAPESSDEYTDREELGDDGTSPEDWTDIFPGSDAHAERNLVNNGSTLVSSLVFCGPSH